jgi:hypothetical protein
MAGASKFLESRLEQIVRRRREIGAFAINELTSAGTA